MINKFLNNNKPQNIYKQLAFFSLTIILASLMFSYSLGAIFADSVDTQVTVGNNNPEFTVDPAENAASDSTTPTDVGADVTFEATATDDNSEDYYLAICKSDAITPVNSGAPTCDGGNWCISTATTSGNQSTCDYTVLVGDTLESYAWYAFVCDGNSSSAACSASDQGTGSSGSPFSVNHNPDFPTISSDSPKNPGETVTFSTDASTLDGDTDGVADTVKLLVCDSAGITAGACDGTQLCASSFVANNPSCGYAIPTPTTDGAKSAFVYVIDSHNLGSLDANQGSNEGYTVNNVAPVVSSVETNGAAAMDMTEGTTTPITITADVTDNNGCGGAEISTVTASLYRSGVTYASCDTNGEDDYDDCYAVESCSEDTCTGSGATYSCNISVQYHADPTDALTEFPAENWLSTVVATDDNAASDSTEAASGVEMNSLTAMDVTLDIDYGVQAIGTNSGNLDQTTTMTSTGNVGVDEFLSGVDMTDGGIETIDVEQQKYDVSAVLYSAATALTTGATELEIDVPKTRSTGTTTIPESADTYWGIEIPGGTVSGVYTGTNTITATKGETVGW